jgi:eukaryotic-like serine/threonine-protein kinase
VANFGERYELIRRIGSGGMGEVWLAHDEQLASRPVAIKIMHQHMLPNGVDVARFEREMRFAAMMDHPNIVTVYTTGTYEDAPFMVMEYLRGNDLEKAPPGGDAELVAGMGRDICSALAYAHRKGVLHRDIKPSNLFLCEGGQVKVTDFGVARAVGGTALTSAGVLVGTFAYLPPERWRGEPPAFSNDIWAAGCVLYRIISGRLPRVLPDAADYAAAAARGDPIPDLHDITDAPAWLAAPVMAMLAGDPADRPTAVDCLKLLSGARPARPAAGGRLLRRLLPAETDPGRPGLSPVTDAGEEPAGAFATRPTGARTTAGRSQRPRWAAVAIGGAALLLLAGSITAWRLSDSPRVAELAARGTVTSPAASRTAGTKTPAAAALAPRSSSAGPPGSAAASPAAYRSASPGGSRPASPASSRSASPSRSPATSRSATPSASPTASASAASTPPLVTIPAVVGLTFTKAETKLENHGFTVVGKHTRVGQIVTRTNPSGQAPAGSKIIVVYGTGAAL